MSKVSGPQIVAVIAGIFSAAFLLNYFLVWFGLKPYIYCGLKDVLWELWQPMQVLISLAGLLFFMWSVAVKNYSRSLIGVFLMVGAYVLPDWGTVLFSLGKGCA